MSTQKKKTVNDAFENIGIGFTPIAWEELNYWITTDAKTYQKLSGLIKECQRTPYEGTGKPKPLNGPLSGFWSRRIDHKNRLVYVVVDGVVTIISCRYHYDDK